MATTADILPLVHAHGRAAVSFQVLHPDFCYWWHGEYCVAYYDTGAAWVAAGPPLSPMEAFPAICTAFVAAARASGRRAVFFGVEQRFVDTVDGVAIKIGEQPVWDPAGWAEIVARTPSLKEQLRRATAKGVTIRTLTLSDVAVGAPTRHQIEQLIARWQDSRAMAPMGFLVAIHPFDFAAEQMYLVAERHGRVIAFLSAIPVYLQSGWFIDNFTRDPAAPNGTVELLADRAMRQFAERGAHYATLGLSPLSGNVSPLLRHIAAWSRSLYDFGGLRAFKAKLRPHRWEPAYIVRPRDTSATLAVLDVLTAFARGSLLRFGLRTIFRVPPIVITLLAALLVPWTLALAFCVPSDWFPKPWMHAGWVAFDVALTGALFTLVQRWRMRLAVALATLVSADAVTTFAQVALYDWSRDTRVVPRIVFAIGAAAPLSAAILLWRAVTVRLRLTRR